MEKKETEMKITLVLMGILVGYLALYFLGKAIEGDDDPRVARDKVRQGIWNTYGNTPGRETEVRY